MNGLWKNIANQPPLYLFNTAVIHYLCCTGRLQSAKEQKYKLPSGLLGKRFRHCQQEPCAVELIWKFAGATDGWRDSFALPRVPSPHRATTPHSQGSVPSPCVISHPYQCLEGVSHNRPPGVTSNYFPFVLINVLLNFTVKTQCIFFRTWILNCFFKLNFEAETFQD